MVRLSTFVSSMAACVAVSVLATTYFARPNEQKAVTETVQRSDGQTASASRTRLVDTGMAPNLVAVSVTADWCPMCPPMVPVFTALRETHGQDVLFVVFDITDDTVRRQAEYLAATLGIEWLCSEPMRTGTIKLIDRQKQTVLASASGPNQLPAMESALSKVHP